MWVLAALGLWTLDLWIFSVDPNLEFVGLVSQGVF